MNKFYGKLGCLTAVILLVVWRCPALLVEPRFWAEEGKFYFASAYNNGFWYGLFAPHFGYFSLVPNAATAFATLLPLEVAPFFTTYFAVLMQILVCSLVIFGTSPFWDTLPQKLLVACGILLLAPGEVWLTSICTQYWLAIAVFLLMLEPTEGQRRLRRWFVRSLMLTAGLTSIQSCFLVPFFLLKGWRTRSRELFVQTAILASATFLQIAVLLSSIGKDPQLNARFGGSDLSLAKIVQLQIVLPFVRANILGSSIVSSLDEDLFYRGFYLDAMPYFGVLICALGISSFILCMAWYYRRDKDRQLIIGSFLLTVILSTLLSLRMASAPRYAFAPSVMLLVLFAGELSFQRLTKRTICTITLLVVFIISGLGDFRGSVFYRITWPSWTTEVAIWRSQPGYELKIWPQFSTSHWTMALER